MAVDISEENVMQEESNLNYLGLEHFTFQGKLKQLGAFGYGWNLNATWSFLSIFVWKQIPLYLVGFII